MVCRKLFCVCSVCLPHVHRIYYAFQSKNYFWLGIAWHSIAYRIENGTQHKTKLIEIEMRQKPKWTIGNNNDECQCGTVIKAKRRWNILFHLSNMTIYTHTFTSRKRTPIGNPIHNSMVRCRIAFRFIYLNSKILRSTAWKCRMKWNVWKQFKKKKHTSDLCQQKQWEHFDGVTSYVNYNYVCICIAVGHTLAVAKFCKIIAIE